ncbi:hypothetical protein MHM98_05225 [Psychrobium sp. MM17-31]|uniref:hypothetical protein n=1 Tax=Psychrobium sp. MM17-31 TaxID=2917758 RepID=UPI001EF5C998|nr:hypothetical protein [Psychrobium sp. MM17-31]MCG7530757.1 hypothetical protein [Psychrobium sp. MM17-31]
MKYLILSLLFSSLTFASEECILTESYKDARKQVYIKSREILKPYLDCKKSMKEAFHWKAVAACTKQGLGKNIGGGCSHLVNYGSFPMKEVDVSHCEVFKLPIETVKAYREELKQQIDVPKCKT